MTYENVLVTGADTHLGGAVSDVLTQNEVTVVVCGGAEEIARLPKNPFVKPLKMDLLLESSALPFLPRIDAVVHCAELRKGTKKQLAAANVVSTKNALAIAKASGARRFIHVSTAQTYAAKTDLVAVGEEAKLPKARTDYVRTKRAAEALVKADRQLHSAILRPALIYGPSDHQLFSQFVQLAEKQPLPFLRGGHVVRDILHIDDAVQAIIAALYVETLAPASAFNISSGEHVRTTDIIEMITRQMYLPILWKAEKTSLAFRNARRDQRAAAIPFLRKEQFLTQEIVDWLAYTFTLDISAAEQQLGWTPQISWEEGLRSLFSLRAVTCKSEIFPRSA